MDFNRTAAQPNKNLKDQLLQSSLLHEFLMCEVMDYSPFDRTYQVRPFGDTKIYIALRLLDSPQTGKGISDMFVPAAFTGKQCLCLRSNNSNTFSIIGFPQVTDLLPGGSTRKEIVHEPGTRSLRGENGQAHIDIYKSGLVKIVAHAYHSLLELDPVKMLFTLLSKNAKILFGNGSSVIKNVVTNKANLFSLKVKKELEETPAVLLKENINIEMGNLGDKGNHLVEATLSQDYMAVIPNHTTTWKLGKQDDGKILSMECEDVTKQSKVKLHVDSSTGEFNYAAETVTGNKCEIVVTPSGDIKLSTTNKEAKIILGGEGKEQALVTKAWVTDVFAPWIAKEFNTHTHVTSLGTPTFPPSPQATPSTFTKGPEVDDTANLFTNTTKAE